MSSSTEKPSSSSSAAPEKVDVFVVSSQGQIREERKKMGDVELSEKERLRQGSSSGGVTGKLVLAVLLAVSGSFCFGYNTGVINAPEAMIKSFMNATEEERDGDGGGMSENKLTSLFALIVAIFAVGGCAGGVFAGWWADFFGRKNGMAVNAIIGLLAAALMFFSKMAGSYEMIIVGRLLIGFNCGVYTGVSPMYLSEISTAQSRGALGVLHQLGVVCGLLLSQALGFPEVLGNAGYWHLLLGVTFVPCLAQLLLFAFCPESPRYLLITKKQEDQATEALRTLRGTDDVAADIEEMKIEAAQQDAEPKVSLLSVFGMPELRKPLMVSIVMHLSQQLSGINGIFYYSASLFKGAGLDAAAATHATSGVGGVMVVMTLITVPLMDRVGRRTLHLIGLAGMFGFSILITVTLALRNEVEWFKVGSIVVSLLYVVFFALGPGSIPWLIVSELFPQGSRSAAISVSVPVNWVANFVVGYTFPFMQKGLGDFTFLPFTALLLVFFIVLFVHLPETKGRTFEEIAAGWRHPNSGNGQVPSSSPAKESTYLVSYSNTMPTAE